MKNKNLISNIFLANLLTVSTIANADSTAQNNPSAKLVIYRPNDGSRLSYRFWVDDQYMCKLEPEEVLELQLSPGDHVISSNDHNRSELSVTVNEQGTTFVRTGIYRKTRLSLEVDTSRSESIAGL
jgi:hypothetical protein